MIISLLSRKGGYFIIFPSRLIFQRRDSCPAVKPEEEFWAQWVVVGEEELGGRRPLKSCLRWSVQMQPQSVKLEQPNPLLWKGAWF